MHQLSQTFIPAVFRTRGWSPLLLGFGNVCESLMGEFVSNTIAHDGHLDCWVRGKEFQVSPTTLSDLL